MTFDPCNHKVNMILIACGELFFPEEKNVTALLNKTAALIGVQPEEFTSDQADHLPTPQETGPFFLCPKCGIKKLTIDGLCPTCTESEDGKFHSKLSCSACGFSEKSIKHIVTQLIDFGHDFSSSQKETLGIKTITDQGKK